MKLDNHASSDELLGWNIANQTVLRMAVDEVRATLEGYLASMRGNQPAPEHISPPPGVTLMDQNGAQLPSTLDTLCQTFDLSPFERNVLVLCAAMEVDADFGGLCAEVHGNPDMTFPTFCLALKVFSGGDWSICSPQSTLRKWELIDVQEGASRVFRPIAIQERILDYLLGNTGVDARLNPFLRPLTAPPDSLAKLGPAKRDMAERLVAHFTGEEAINHRTPAPQLWGNNVRENRAIAAVACSQMGCSLYALPVSILPRELTALDRILRLIGREALLNNSFVLLECYMPRSFDASDLFEYVLGRLQCPLIVASTEPRFSQERTLVKLDGPPKSAYYQLSSAESAMILPELAAEEHG